MKRGRTSRDVPPPLELECLRALWVLKEANVQAIRDYLAVKRPLAYTTVMTMMDRLTRKQMLSRRKVGRAFVYTPLLTRDEARRRAVDELVETLFGGNRAELKGYLESDAAGAEPAEEQAPDQDTAESRPEHTEVSLDTTLL